MKKKLFCQNQLTITETVKEKELIMPRVDSTEVVSIAEIATKTIVQVQVGNVIKMTNLYLLVVVQA